VRGLWKERLEGSLLCCLRSCRICNSPAIDDKKKQINMTATSKKKKKKKKVSGPEQKATIPKDLS
jgi:hypothetical protein